MDKKKKSVKNSFDVLKLGSFPPRKLIEKTSKEIAKELGIDHAYILGSLKQLADTSEDQNIALQSLKELGKAIGTLGNQVKKIETGVVGMFLTPNRWLNWQPNTVLGGSKSQ